MTDLELIEKAALAIDAHVLGAANGDPTSWAWIECSCGRVLAGLTREYVTALGRKHQAEALVAVFREHTVSGSADTDTSPDTMKAERESLIEEATWALIEWDTDVADRGVRDEHYRDRRADMERVYPVFEAGFRRGAPAEPAVTAHDGLIAETRPAPSTRKEQEQ